MKKAENGDIFSVPAEIGLITETLEKNGFEAYLIGGCVRDLLLISKPRDWDITTNATPEKIISLFPKTFYENSFGTVGVVNEETPDSSLKVVEVTPYREEGTYSDSRRPDSVKFSTKLQDDLKRRDFTVNAIALKITKLEGNDYKGHLIDLYKGQEDLSRKIIRTVGDPMLRFQEDGLRLLRAVRIAVELGFSIENATAEAIKQQAQLLKKIASERIRDEFTRVILSKEPMRGLTLLYEFGLLVEFLPELQEGIGIEQNKAHAFHVWEHTLRTVQHAADKGFPLEVRLAALFHDVGKPRTRRHSPEKNEWTFYGHEVVGARIAEKALERLHFPKKINEKVVKLVRWHMFFSDTEQISLSAVRRIISQVGTENIWDLMNVRICDRIGTGRPKENPYRLRKYKAMIEEVLRDPISVGMLKIDGRKIMETSGISAGPKVGHILHALLEEVLEDPTLNNTSYLEKKAQELSQLDEEKLKNLGELAKSKKEGEDEKKKQEILKKYGVS